jgi:hypothetical protein
MSNAITACPAKSNCLKYSFFLQLQIRELKMKSDGKFFRITFRSNNRLDGTGFRAFYAFETEKPTTESPQVIHAVENQSLSKFSYSKCASTKFLKFFFPLILSFIPPFQVTLSLSYYYRWY